MASGPDSGPVQVVHGANERTFPLSGRLIGDVKRSLRDIFNIPYFASAFLNGAVVDLGRVLRAGDRLEFLQTFGFKGSGDLRNPAVQVAEALIQDSPELRRISDRIKSSWLNKDDSIDETVRLVSRHFIQFYGAYGSSERPILSEVARLLLGHECRIAEIEAKLVSVASEPQKPSEDKATQPHDLLEGVLERPQFNTSRMTMTWKSKEYPFGTSKEFAVLKYLATKFENYISLNDIIDEVWQDSSDIERNTAHKTISILRSKLNGKMLAGITGRTLTPGEDINLDAFVGKTFLVMVTNTEIGSAHAARH